MKHREARERGLLGMDVTTRRRVESAARKLFSRQELHKVKLIDIATEARISLQTVYKYYGSKETLLLSCLDVWLTELTNPLIEHLETSENHKDRLRTVFWLTLDYFGNNPEVARIIMASVYLDTWRDDESFRQHELMSLLLKVFRKAREENVLSQEVDEIELLDLFLGVTTRKVSMWLLRDRREKLTDNAYAVFEMLWRAMASPATLKREYEAAAREMEHA